MKIAAIDIGSNSVHMIVADADEDGAFDIVDREKDVIRLGAGTFRSGRLSREAVAAGVQSLKRMGRLIQRHGVEHVVTVATSAVREASNSAVFLETVAEQTGIQPVIVNGNEEGRLIHLGVKTSIDLAGKTALILDIGGGSVEAVVGHERGVVLSKSMKLGVLRLRDLLGDDEPPTREGRKRLEGMISEQSQRVLNHSSRLGYDMVIGTSGTILSLGLAAYLRRGHERWKSANGQVIRVGEISDLADLLIKLPAAERGSVPGVDSHRSETIHLGAVLLLQLLKLSGAEAITLCGASVREGLIVDFLNKHAGSQARRDATDLRAKSALALLRRCGQHGPHALHVQQLALQLFDQTAAVHKLNAGDRRLLEYSALLHDVGRGVGFERHEHHGFYIVQNAELHGFTEREIEMISLIVRYHRKARPRTRELPALRRRDVRTLNILAGLVRVAEGLDRGHTQTVTSVTYEGRGDDGFSILVQAEGDAELEVWSARSKSALLSRALDQPVRFEAKRKVCRV